jgi:serralysin
MKPRVCIDRKVTPADPRLRLALVRDRRWGENYPLRIRFLEGDPDLCARVKQAAAGWLDYANLRFVWTQAPPDDVRISFSTGGSWSLIGKDAADAPAGAATMNFGWLTTTTDATEVRRVVLHEFGHALGCIHEHQSPAGGIHWNKDAVYAYYMGDPNKWTKEDVDRNIFQPYSEDLTVHTEMDPSSIMMYPIDPSFTTDGFSVGWNTQLSPTDISFIREMYPH